MTVDLQQENLMNSDFYQPPNKTRILVVEDDSHLLTGIRDILQLEDYDVLTAQNGKAALQLLREDPDNPPAVIVSDIMMPHMDGFEFLKEVREEDRWVMVPFIFLTAKGERDDRYKGRMMGADQYLTKPFDAEDLLVAVSSSLSRTANMRRVKEGEVIEQKRKILTILNHEFRTPLTLVVAYADMLKDFDPDNMNDQEIMSFLRGVNSGADRLRRLVENFIMLVELDTGEALKTIQWRKRPVEDLSLILDDAHRQVALPEQRPRNYIIDVEEDLPAIEVDVQYITIAIRELMDNAAKFTEANDTIRVQATHVDDAIEISVEDNGRGIPADEIKQIWDPFYQIDREHFEDQGAGSGLAIVDGILKLHNGSRKVQSSHGEGSTFTIRLPLKPDEPETLDPLFT